MADTPGTRNKGVGGVAEQVNQRYNCRDSLGRKYTRVMQSGLNNKKRKQRKAEDRNNNQRQKERN